MYSNGQFEANLSKVQAALSAFSSFLVTLMEDETLIDASGAVYDTNVKQILEAAELLTDEITKFNLNTSDVNISRFWLISTALSSLANALVDMSSLDPEEAVDSLETAINNLSTLLSGNTPNSIDSTTFLQGLDASSIKTKLDGFISTVETDVLGFTEGLSAQEKTLIESGESLGGAVNSGIGQTSNQTSGVTLLLSTIQATANGYRDDFETTGRYLGTGLAIGLYKSVELCKIAAVAIMKAMIQAAKTAANINSPSKETEEIGMYFDLGLVKGVRGFSGAVVLAAEDMSYGAITATKNILSNLSTIVDSDFNADPVIRPVVDLSNVSAGATAINGLFSRRNVIGVEAARSKALANSISIPNKGDRQNGSGTEVGGGTQYNDNGFTLTGNNFYIRNEQDIHTLSQELAALTQNQQRSLGKPNK